MPFHLRKGVNKQLQKLLEADIIDRADGPTLWLSKMIRVPKANTDEVRMCVDMKVANNAIKRERQPTPTIDDEHYSAHGSKFFG